MGMSVLLSTLKSIVCWVIRGAMIYLGFYAYIFLAVPLSLAFDAWLQSWLFIPLWALVGFYSVGAFFFELYRLWPEAVVEPVLLSGSCRLVSEGRYNTLRGRRRTSQSRLSFPGVVMYSSRPLHRQYRFGRTRIR